MALIYFSIYLTLYPIGYRLVKRHVYCYIVMVRNDDDAVDSGKCGIDAHRVGPVSLELRQVARKQ